MLLLASYVLYSRIFPCYVLRLTCVMLDNLWLSSPIPKATCVWVITTWTGRGLWRASGVCVFRELTHGCLKDGREWQERMAFLVHMYVLVTPHHCVLLIHVDTTSKYSVTPVGFSILGWIMLCLSTVYSEYMSLPCFALLATTSEVCIAVSCFDLYCLSCYVVLFFWFRY